MRRLALLVVLLAVGLTATMLALRSREGNTQFVAQRDGGGTGFDYRWPCALTSPSRIAEE
jgi:hypothetical protein